MSGGIKDDTLAWKGLQGLADIVEGLIPRDFDIAIAGFVITKWVRQPARLFEIVVFPAAK